MAKIQITIDYEPVMDSYPAGTTTKAQAMTFDVNSVKEGLASAVDLIEWADTVEIEVVE